MLNQETKTPLKLIFTYDGSFYHGFQRQTQHHNTIQEVLENRLSSYCNDRITVTASGRTDAGVHARVQVAQIKVPLRVSERFADGDYSKMVFALNCILPNTVRMLKIEKAPLNFHPIRQVKKKTYLYFIDASPVQWPALRHYAWHLRLPLDWKLMEESLAKLQGTHDFAAFCGSGSSAKTTVRTLFEAQLAPLNQEHSLPFAMGAQLWAIRLTGNGFLKQMVRSIVGTLVQIGNHRTSAQKFDEMLAQRDRSRAGLTAPPQGLWLWDIQY